MRTSSLAIALLVGAAAIVPRHAPAQISVSLHLGRPVVVTNYAPESYGDWRTGYRSWTPVTLYYYDGNWYPRAVRGGRAVVVYRTGGRYFLPPQDAGWDRHDRRYNYRRRPSVDDYNHVQPPPPRSNPPGRGRGRP